jgi:hypothetical protein
MKTYVSDTTTLALVTPLQLDLCGLDDLQVIPLGASSPLGQVESMQFLRDL